MGAEEWDCPACTYINASTAVRCEMCMTLPPSSKSPSSSSPNESMSSCPNMPLHGANGMTSSLSSPSPSPLMATPSMSSPTSSSSACCLEERRDRYWSGYTRLCLDLDFFMQLPSELNAAIFGLLEVKDVIHLSLVCRWLCDEIARSDYVWRQMFIKTYQREHRFILMEGLDNGMARTGWRRAFKLQFYLQVMADLCELLSESKFYLVHTSLKPDAKDHGGAIVYDKSVGVEEGGEFSLLYRWRGEQLRLPLDSSIAAPEESDCRNKPGDWLEDVGTVAEWDEEFQHNLHSRIKKCIHDDERDEVISLGTTWISKGPLVRQLCEQFTRCIIRRDYEEDASRNKRDVNKGDENPGQGKQGDSEVGGNIEELEEDTLQRILNKQSNWKERDRSSVRKLMVKMLSKQPPIIPPYAKLPFDAWKVAKEYVDALLDLFRVGERGCARYLCLAKEFSTRANDRFLALGVLIVSPYRVLSLISIYDLTLVQLDAVRMHKYMLEIDTPGYNYEDEDEQEVVLPDGPWACPFCTFINIDSKYKCDACENYRSSKQAV